jgi:hypothetical protein
MLPRITFPAVVLLAVASVLAPKSLVAQDDLVQTLSTIEKTLWEAWKSHDAGPFHLYLADNSVTISAGGIEAGKQTVIESIENSTCDVKGFSFSDWAVHQVSKNVAILTYRATQDAVCDGEKIAEKVVVGAVYVRQDGKWLSTSYQETPAGT